QTLKGASGVSPAAVALIFPKHLLATFVTLLGLERQRSDGSRIEPLEPDGLAGLLAVAVGALLDARERRVDLGDQLALPITRPKLQGAVGLGCGTVGKIGMLGGILMQDEQCLAILPDDLFFPSYQFVAEIGAVTLVHERLVLGRAIAIGQ